jgi:hypothetical protein
MGAKQVKNIFARIFAVFVASALSVIGAGAIAGVSIVQSMAIAGLAGVATVVEGLARAFLDDGTLDEDEVNSVFNAAPTKKPGTK